MKVLFITNFFPPRYMGGAGVSAVNSCYGLLRRGHECSVLSINPRFGEDVDRSYAFKGIPVREVGYQHRLRFQVCQVFDRRIYRRIVWELERTKPDLVHVHNVSGTSLAPFVACRKLGVPTVLTLHDHWLLCPNNMLFRRGGTLCNPASRSWGCKGCYRRYDFWGDIPWRRSVFARLVQNVRLFIAPSQKLVDLHVMAGYDQERFRVLKSGIEPDLFQSPAASAAQLDQEYSSFNTLLFSGAIVETKGVDTIIHALPLLAKYIDRFHLLVAGWGDDAFMNKLRRYEPAPVKLLGKIPFYELKVLYASAKLTLVPSIWYDNSPIVIYESLLAGTPVLGSDIGGIPELIREGNTGYLVEPGDPIAFAEKAILHFARPARERRAMRWRCAEYANENLTLDHHIEGLLSIYHEALG